MVGYFMKLASPLAAITSRFTRRRNDKGAVSRFIDLAPTDKADPAGVYSSALTEAIENPRVMNIALTGPYGSGKSSIRLRGSGFGYWAKHSSVYLTRRSGFWTLSVANPSQLIAIRLQETRKIASETDTLPSLKNGKRFEQNTTDGLASRCEKDAGGTPMHMRLSQK
ncbi:hypothetical protein HGP16_19815 [Rhizobium sp. P40RR-XXII]|uniref:YobI family P-loop NTPase n=1 Tax=unclassified Rhizobium TaxID=2613769 RepID=UPI00145673E6|nr:MULTISPECIES: hypothetical protein [unclassified Rhizobium]NLR86050.1 hypothetical protein [Rhizobium sp. P28RR-XV]NLS18795.1 hypothetical protein [Rhizobium sp. P40RR-XXII]